MKKTITTLALIVTVVSLIAQEDKKDEFVPSGKVSANIFANYHGGLGDSNTDSHEFELQRAYFGYKYQLTEIFTGKVNMDIGNPSDGGKLERTTYLKEASLSFKKGGLSGSFGLIGLKQFKAAEKVWGHRYVYKTVQDANKLGSSADAGIYVHYKIHDMVSIDATMINGEGYKKLQADNTYKNAFGLTLNPVKGLVVRGYYDMYPKGAVQSTISTFVGYTIKGKVAVGVEYNMQSNHKSIDGDDIDALSGFASYDINDKFQVFARFDNVDDRGTMEQLAIGGVQYTAAKNIKIAANYQGKTIASNTISYAYLSLNVKL